MKNLSPVPSSSLQMLIVITDSATAITGKMTLYQRTSPNREWAVVDGPIEVRVGRNGLAAGKGIYSTDVLTSLPEKAEGDGKSPAGIFWLSQVFGYTPADSVPGLKMPYLPISQMTECVDDITSQQYNRIVYRDKVEKVDWKSSEKMSNMGSFYELGIVVKHNQSPIKKGCGSCIFLHNWSDPVMPTSGCTSMAPPMMKKIAGWLDIHKKPILVQLPATDYQALRLKWALPFVSF